MKKVLILGTFAAMALIGVYLVITIYDANMKLGRMRETPAVRPHEEPLLTMERSLVPFEGGESLYKEHGAASISKPASLNLETGKKEYMVFCSHCHGNHLDGQGTVGQSFSPLPRDLTSKEVAKLNDDTLFNLISYGKKRGPALATTVSIKSRWEIINFIRSKQK